MDVWTGVLASVILGGVLGAIITWLIDQLRQRQHLRRLLDMLDTVERLTLNEQFLLTGLLADKLRKSPWKRPHVIFAVSPGGAMVAEWLSRRFLGDFKKPIPVCTLPVKTIRTATGDRSTQAIFESRKIAEGCAAWPVPHQGKVLLVSDISRGGGALTTTYEFLAQHYDKDTIAIAVLMYQVGGGVTPSFSLLATKRVVQFDWKEER